MTTINTNINLTSLYKSVGDVRSAQSLASGLKISVAKDDPLPPPGVTVTISDKAQKLLAQNTAAQTNNTSTPDTSLSSSLAAALSNLKDVNVANESSNLYQEQVMAQAGASVLAQANQTAAFALKLLG